MADFFEAGGYGMFPITAFGFLLVAVSVLYALRPGPKYRRPLIALGVTTFTTGLLSTAFGVCLSARYIHQVATEKQLGILAMGIDESMHNIVLSLIMVVLASSIATLGAFREGKAAAA